MGQTQQHILKAEVHGKSGKQQRPAWLSLWKAWPGPEAGGAPLQAQLDSGKEICSAHFGCHGRVTAHKGCVEQQRQASLEAMQDSQGGKMGQLGAWRWWW